MADLPVAPPVLPPAAVKAAPITATAVASSATVATKLVKAKVAKKTVSVFAAAMAGTTETLFMYPMDAVKTRLQLAGSNAGMLVQLRDMIEQRAVYRGISSPLSCDPFKRAIKFAAFEFYLAWLEAGSHLDGSQVRFLAGAMAGATETIFECPFENVKCKMQSATNMRAFSSPAQCAAMTFAEGGVAPFYNGLQAHACRNMIWNATYFGTMGIVSKAVSHSPEDSFALQLLKKFVAGTIGGASGTVLNTPFDVVKSRLQAEALAPGARRAGVMETMVHIARHEGVGNLYRGLYARFIRLGLGGGIMIAGYEFFQAVILHVVQ